MSVYEDVIIAGFGGQGVLLSGNLLAYAAMQENLQVLYMPVYGPEMRGGTANCTVVISDEEIGSPLVRRPHSLIALNGPSFFKFGPLVLEGGIIVVNSSLAEASSLERDDLRLLPVPLNELADNLGSAQMINMIALGAYVAASGIISLSSAETALDELISEHYKHLIPKNIQALQAGAAFVETVK